MAKRDIAGSTLQQLLQGTQREAREAQKQIAEETRRHMIDRTVRGIGVNNRKFVRYSKFTQMKKGVGPLPVTLKDTFAMLSDLKVRSSGKGRYEVKFGSRKQQRKGAWQHFGTKRNGRQHIPPRRWFGLTLIHRRKMTEKFIVRTRVGVPKDRRRKFKIELKF